jgi:hypothetical protein
MRARVNDWLRSAIGYAIRGSGIVFGGWFSLRLRRFEVNQDRLRRRYSGSLNLKTKGKFAVTSGSAGDPKRILYTRTRLRACKWIFSDMFARVSRVSHQTHESLRFQFV